MKKITYVSLLCLVLIGGTACSSKESEAPAVKKAKMVEVSKESSTTESSIDTDYPYTYEDIVEKPDNEDATKILKSFIDHQLPIFTDEGFGPKIWPAETDSSQIERIYMTFYAGEIIENRPKPGVMSLSVYQDKDSFDKALDMEKNPSKYDLPVPVNSGYISSNENTLSILSSNHEFDEAIWNEYESAFLSTK